MKTLRILLLIVTPLLFLYSCSEDKMDEINKERNATTEMGLDKLITDIVLKSAFESTGTDIAWYTSVYVELNTGSWNQMNSADVRQAQEAGSLMNNSWNSLYDVMNICQRVIMRTDPGAADEDATLSRAIALTMMAYNIAITTDGWGEVPYTEALQGAVNLQPTYDMQSAIYPKIQSLLSEAITLFGQNAGESMAADYIYGGNPDMWTMAAYSLKARYAMRLSEVSGSASTDALAAVANGFTDAFEALVFDSYEASGIGENPWYQFYNDRSHHSTSKSLYDLMMAREDTSRMDMYFTKLNDTIRPAPNGTSEQTQGGIYSQSLKTTDGRTAGTPMMTYHELLFIKAEAEFRTSAAGWQATLQEAIEENFAWHGLTVAEGTTYYTASVMPLLTAGNELIEIMTQKYIGAFEHEAIEAYNDYKRTGIPTMTNPNNNLTGFVWRFPYPTSETSSNSNNVPDKDVFADKVWWAGGSE
ncbi:MAG TPA: SusD/RagB family nutrient-binding outer membrane lipoprotein [Bacteroides sp.]|nr:SusD/RagB family nutrient-binding outer membrane lipoprotein [Bacteroides sp.]